MDEDGEEKAGEGREKPEGKGEVHLLEDKVGTDCGACEFMCETWGETRTGVGRSRGNEKGPE